MQNIQTRLKGTWVRVLTVVLTLSLVLTSVLALQSNSFAMATTEIAPAASPEFIGYDVSVDSTQAVVVTFHYDDAVWVDPSNNPTTKVTINAANIAASRIHNTASGNDFIVTIDASMGYSSIFSGLITVDSDMYIVRIGGESGVDATPISSISTPSAQYFPETVIPLGTTLSTDGQGSSTVIVNVGGEPHTNGMIHVGIYYEDTDNNTLVPIWTDKTNNTDPIQIFTYTVFIDSYDSGNPPTAYQVAKLIATYVGSDRNFDADKYSIEAGGTPGVDGTLTVIDKSMPAKKLYVLIFDDELIQAIHSADSAFDYPSLLAAGDGVLPLYPY